MNSNQLISRFLNNFSWLVLFNACGHLLSFLVFPVLIKKFGLSDVGIILTIQALVFLISAVSNFSFPFYIPTQSKKISLDSIYCFNLWNLVVQVRLMLSLLLAGISTLIVYFLFEEYFLIWSTSLLLFLPKIINPNLFFNALEKNHIVFKIGFLSKLIFFILLCFCNSFLLVNPLLAITELLVTIFVLSAFNVNYLKFKITSFEKILVVSRRSLHLFYVNILSIINAQTILPIISLFFGSYYAALYGIAEKITKGFKIISGNIFVGIFPLYNKNELKWNRFSKRLFLIGFSTLSFVIFVILLLSGKFVYYMNNFTENSIASDMLKVLSITIFKAFLIIPLFSYLLQNNYWRFILRAHIYQLVLFVLLTVFVLFVHEGTTVYSFSWVVLVSEFTLLILYFYYFLKSKQKSFSILKNKCPRT